MKHITAYIIPAALCLLCSCVHSKTEWVGEFDDLDPQTTFVPYRTQSETIDESSIQSCRCPGGQSAGAVSEEETKTTSTNGTALIKGISSCVLNKKAISYCGTYQSIDQNGDPITLSGRVVLPTDRRPSRIMIVCHFTIGADYEAPTREFPIEGIFASMGIAVMEADYIGYGVTADHIHPYLCSDLTAQNVIDMYFAAKKFLEHIDCEPENEDIFVFGYSQGGAVALSTAQMLEKKYPEVKIRLALCGAGPYDICATYNTLVDLDITDYPCAVPMIIQGLNYGMSLNLDYSDYFNQRMVDNMDNWLNKKIYTMGQVTEAIGSKRLSSILTQAARDKSTDIMTELYKAMMDNSALNDDMPSCPMYVFHSYDDTVVPYVNAYNLIDKIHGYNVIYNTGHYGGHVPGYLRFLLSSIDLLKTNGDIK